MLKTRVRLPALTYGINKLITLANIRKYRNIMYGHSHDEAEKATSALKVRKGEGRQEDRAKAGGLLLFFGLLLRGFRLRRVAARGGLRH